jgi:hypothetical protein
MTLTLTVMCKIDLPDFNLLKIRKDFNGKQPSIPSFYKGLPYNGRV